MSDGSKRNMPCEGPVSRSCGGLPSHFMSAIRFWLSARPPEQTGFTVPAGFLAMRLSFCISGRQMSTPVGAMLDPLIIPALLPTLAQ